ncbi:cannabidiolic acid synthase-like [Olea europaea subsp. europaea]|uniref:Cannabidiolic acid synthase-like n=1 Tax=Olea europaea subsp. europaea TaxID=158383 RepID=A0A8S0UG95_OLEEU|nr:cannabidiolic acid synthase-like [Olea europaea subsp. europaea]
MSWIESILYWAGFPIESRDVLLNRTQPNVRYFKAKSDYVQIPISKNGLEGIWKLFFEDKAEEDQMILVPYGGRMHESSEFEISFPHRAGNLNKIQHLVFWGEEEVEASQNYINWIRKLYGYMTPYVSRFPRAAYINYRDLDIGVNEKGNTSYAKASIWGIKYFKNNFNRLVQVKTKVDPSNSSGMNKVFHSSTHGETRAENKILGEIKCFSICILTCGLIFIFVIRILYN